LLSLCSCDSVSTLQMARCQAHISSWVTPSAARAIIIFVDGLTAGSATAGRGTLQIEEFGRGSSGPPSGKFLSISRPECSREDVENPCRWQTPHPEAAKAFHRLLLRRRTPLDAVFCLCRRDQLRSPSKIALAMPFRHGPGGDARQTQTTGMPCSPSTCGSLRDQRQGDERACRSGSRVDRLRVLVEPNHLTENTISRFQRVKELILE
jgi:hypothetical protein